METTSHGDVQDTFVCEEVKALLDKKVFSGQKILLNGFQDLEERVKSLTITLEDSKEEHKEMLKQNLLLKKEYTLANNELDKLKNKNSDFWTECQHYINIYFDLNYKLRGREVLKVLPPEIEKLYKEIKTLRDNQGKFIGGHEVLNNII